MALKAWSERLTGKQENNGVYFAKEDTLINRLDTPDPELLEENAGYVNALVNNVDVPVYFGIIPSAAEIWADRLPAGAPTADEKSAFDSGFTRSLRDFYAVAENYPDLKASANYLHLQRTLNELEEQLSAARRTYNAVVTDYNNAIQVFPSSLVADMFRFAPARVLETPAAEQTVPNVRNLFNNH